MCAPNPFGGTQLFSKNTASFHRFTVTTACDIGRYSSPNSMARCRVLQSNPAGAPVAWGAARAEPTITITPTTAALIVARVNHWVNQSPSPNDKKFQCSKKRGVAAPSPRPSDVPPHHTTHPVMCGHATMTSVGLLMSAVAFVTAVSSKAVDSKPNVVILFVGEGLSH